MLGRGGMDQLIVNMTIFRPTGLRSATLIREAATIYEYQEHTQRLRDYCDGESALDGHRAPGAEHRGARGSALERGQPVDRSPNRSEERRVGKDVMRCRT